MTYPVSPSSPTPDLAFTSQHLFIAILWVDEALRITLLKAQTEWSLIATYHGWLLNRSILTLLATNELSEKVMII